MNLRECGEAKRVLTFYLIISSLITILESRNIQEQDELHPPANNAATNLMSELKEKLNSVLFSAKEIYSSDENQNANKGAQERSIDILTENIPIDESFQYKHHATPHPTLQDDGSRDDYNDNTFNTQETVNKAKKKVETDDAIEWSKEESKAKNGDEEKSDKEMWIPDCDIPPYPDMQRKTFKNLSEEDDEDRENNADKKDDYQNNVTVEAKSEKENSDSIHKQKLEDKVTEELLDGSSGDMPSENIGRTGGVSSVGEETVSITSEDDFLKNLKELKDSLRKMLNDKAPQESHLRNIVGEISKVLENRFGEVENMHEKLRVRDLYSRDKVKKIQDYHRKSTSSADDNENALLEVKKTRKQLKLIAKNNEEDLLPDYIELMQELISMLRTTKYVVKGIKTTDNDERRENKEEGSSRKMMNSERSNELKDIDTLEKDYNEDLQEKDGDFKDSLSNHFRKQIKSRDDIWGLEESETDSEEEYEKVMMKKQKKKKKKKEKRKKEKKNKIFKKIGSLGRKVPEDL